jgi:outer membrane receptor for ferrienterochelin and colicin
VSSELSVRYGSRATAVSLTGYYTTITDFIDRAPGTFDGDTLFNGERVFQGINVGEARVWGIEAEAAQQIGPIEAKTNLVYTVGNQTPAGGIQEPMSKIPPLGGVVTLRWSTPDQPFWVEYLFRWAMRQDRLGSRDERDSRIPDQGTPGYAVHGFRAGASLANNLDISAGFENVADRLYRPHARGVDAALEASLVQGLRQRNGNHLVTANQGHIEPEGIGIEESRRHGAKTVVLLDLPRHGPAIGIGIQPLDLELVSCLRLQRIEDFVQVLLQCCQPCR